MGALRLRRKGALRWSLRVLAAGEISGTFKLLYDKTMRKVHESLGVSKTHPGRYGIPVFAGFVCRQRQRPSKISPLPTLNSLRLFYLPEPPATATGAYRSVVGSFETDGAKETEILPSEDSGGKNGM